MKFYCKFFTLLALTLSFSYNANSNGTHNDILGGEVFSGFRNLSVVKGKKYMVSSADEVSSKAGQAIIEQGGNAIDAAIAAQLVLNVVEPHSSGIGGGGFLLHYNAKTAKSTFFNGRETAPAASYATMFLDKKTGKARDFTDVVRGGLSVGTPSLLKMMKEAHDQEGRLPWASLFEPAIEAARKGFVVNERMHNLSKQISLLKNFGEASEIYLTKEGNPHEIGDVITNPKMAATLETIAAEGIDPFYKGHIARDIVAAVRGSKINPGTLGMSDLRNYQVKTGNLICSTYRVKYKVCSMPLPSSGGITLLQILSILENFDLKSMKPTSAEAIHLIIEASRLAYADRSAYIADMSNVPVTQMLDKLYLRERSKLIRSTRAIAKILPGKFPESEIIANRFAKSQDAELPSTTHISVVDEDGNAVSLTSSIEYFFGSALSVDGFMLNNQLTDFSLTPYANGKYVANRLKPKTQPRSSLTPTLIFDQNDKLLMVVGSPGGPRIIQFVLKAILNYIDWDMDIQEAIDSPNFIAINGMLELEKNTKIAKLKPQLEELGHSVRVVELVSGIHAITVDSDRRLKGGADPRRNGVAVGK